MERERFIILMSLILLLPNLLPQIEKSAVALTTENSKSQNTMARPSALRHSDFLTKSSSPTLLWDATFGGPDQDYAFSLVQTSDNGFISAGGTFSFGAGGSDFWLVKTDSFGNMQWNKTYGGTGDDEAHCLTRTLDGGYAILGTTNSFGAGGYDFWLVKTDSSGNMLWNKTYGGAGDDDAWSIRQTVNGDLILAGWTASFGAGSGDFWLVKTDSSGNMLWNKTYGGALFENAYCIRQTSDGGFALLGYTYSFGAGSSDFWLVKTDGLGNEQWNATYGGMKDDFGFSLVEAWDGGYALAGSTSSFGEGIYDFWLVRTDKFGKILWSNTYGGVGYDEAWSVLQATNHRFILAGWIESFGAGSSDCWLIATDESGNSLWNMTWGGTDYDYAYSILQCTDGNFALTGETQSLGVGGSDFLLIKVSGVADVATTNVTALKTVVGQGNSMNINVTTANEGDFAETFTVTAYASDLLNTYTIGKQQTTLNPAQKIILTYIWNTTGVPKGNYTIWAYADAVLGETDTADNTFTDGRVLVTIQGDVNGDRMVDIFDIVRIALAYGSKPSDPSWDPNADANNDGTVDIFDIVIAAIHFGENAL